MLTVRDVFSRPPLAAAQRLAGAGGLARTVVGCRVMDTTGFRRENAGCVILVHRSLLQDTPGGNRRLLSQLYHDGAAAVVLCEEMLPVFPQRPADVAEAAEAMNLPLFRSPDGMRPWEIVMQVTRLTARNAPARVVSMNSATQNRQVWVNEWFFHASSDERQAAQRLHQAGLRVKKPFVAAAVYSYEQSVEAIRLCARRLGNSVPALVHQDSVLLAVSHDLSPVIRALTEVGLLEPGPDIRGRVVIGLSSPRVHFSQAQSAVREAVTVVEAAVRRRLTGLFAQPL